MRRPEQRALEGGADILYLGGIVRTRDLLRPWGMKGQENEIPPGQVPQGEYFHLTGDSTAGHTPQH